MAKQTVKNIVEESLKDFMDDQGYELYNVEFVKEGKDRFLRVYIDRIPHDDKGVSMDDCERVSRFLSEKLDEADPIEEDYYLEVSSPGMDRELIKEEHFERYTGYQVEVRLYQAVDGSKVLVGELLGMNEEEISIKGESGEVINLPKNQVAKTKLAVII